MEFSNRTARLPCVYSLPFRIPLTIANTDLVQVDEVRGRSLVVRVLVADRATPGVDTLTHTASHAGSRNAVRPGRVGDR